MALDPRRARGRNSRPGTAALGVTVRSQWEVAGLFLQAAIRPDHLPIRQGHGEVQGPPPDYHSASGYTGGACCSMPSRPPARSTRTRSRRRSTRPISQTFFGRVKFATDPGHHGLQVAHRWSWRNGRRKRQARPRSRLARGGELPISSIRCTIGHEGASRTSSWRSPLVPAGSLPACSAYRLDHRRRPGGLGLWARGHGADPDLGRHGRDQPDPRRDIVAGMFGLYLLTSALGCRLTPRCRRCWSAASLRRAALLDRGPSDDRPAPLMSLLSTFSVNLVLVGLGTAVWGTDLFNIQVTLPGGSLALHLSRPAYRRRPADGRHGGAAVLSCIAPASARRSAPSRNSNRAPSSLGIPTTRVLADRVRARRGRRSTAAT